MEDTEVGKAEKEERTGPGTDKEKAADGRVEGEWTPMLGQVLLKHTREIDLLVRREERIESEGTRPRINFLAW